MAADERSTVDLIPAARPSWGLRLVGIEGLRGLAALTVVLGHVRAHTTGGVDLGPAGKALSALDGLTLFFALSGFLLFRPFASAIAAGRPLPGAGRFFRNRALRVLPAYAVVFVLASYVLQTTYVRAATAEDGLQGARRTLGPVTEWWHVLLNLSMLQTLVPETLKTGLGVAWSLTVELCFYLVLPALASAAALVVRRGGHRLLAVWLVPAVLVVVGLAGRVVAARTLTGTTDAEVYAQEWGPTWHAVLARSFLPHADLFGYGAAAAVLFVMIERGDLRGRAVTLVRWTAVVGFVVVAALQVGPGLPSVLGMRQWETAPVAVACAALILWAALPGRSGRASWVGRVCESRPLRYAGLVSYSLYLWHLPVLWWLAERDVLVSPSALGYVVNSAVVLAVTLALSVVTYRLVELPALGLKARGAGAPGGGSSGTPAEAGGPATTGSAAPARRV